MIREEAAMIFYKITEKENKESFIATGEIYTDVEADRRLAKAINLYPF